MKIRAALSLVVLALVGCGQGTAVLVEVSATQPITVDHLHVSASIGTAMRAFDVPLKTSSLSPAQSFAIDVGDKYSGSIDVVVDALSASGGVLASGTNSVQLAHGKTVTLTISLGAGVPDGGTTDGGTTDGGQPPDFAQPCGTATTACNVSALTTTCSASGAVTSETCALGCNPDAGAPHCAQIVPTAPIMTSDVYATDVTANTTLPASTIVFDTNTGAITAGGTTVRAANTGTVGPRVVDTASGIAFGIVTTSPPSLMALWSFQSLTIPSGATVFFAGQNAVGITAAKTVNVAGNVSLFAYDPTANAVCPKMTASPGGQGGDNGGGATPPFLGQGGLGEKGTVTFTNSTQNFYYGGGGGGSYATAGGSGAYKSGTNTGGAAGSTYGSMSLSPIIGGSAGGWAIDEGATDSGAGGGAIQIAAGTSITVTGTINAGGCGGKQSGDGTGGSGGGSGGAILLETPTLAAGNSAILVVNGGGGAASGCPTDGQNGLASAAAAAGGICSTANGSAGGAGGASESFTGGSAVLEGPFNVTYYGGAGGGGVGYIRYNVSTTPTLSTATISPAPGSGYTSQGQLTTQ